MQDDRIIDLGRSFEGRHPTLRTAIAALGALGLREAAASAAGSLALADVTLLPPIPDPDKIICIGLNYRDHAKEANMKIPENMSLFSRLTNTLVAHGAPILRPKVSGDLDYEGELGVIIGKPGRHIAERDALDHVFGYTCFNDGSVRDFQLRHSTTAGKNFPSTGGCGPWIVTADEIPDPSRLTLTTRVNGREVQKKGTDNIGIWGRSFGGYAAPRAASFEHRLKACISIGGFYDMGAIWQRFPASVKETVQFAFAAASPEEARTRASACSLEGVLGHMRCPLLIVHSGMDVVCPVEDSERMRREAGGPTRLEIFPEGNHVCDNIPYKVRPLMADWMAQQLRAGR